MSCEEIDVGVGRAKNEIHVGELMDNAGPSRLEGGVIDARLGGIGGPLAITKVAIGLATPQNANEALPELCD